LTCPIVYFGLFGLNKYPGVKNLKKKKKMAENVPPAARTTSL